MSAKEIVTLQVGHYSNFVGAHLWNIQESSFVYSPAEVKGPKEICHDVLYREGETRRREVTFTPRLIAFDLKGSLKTLKQEGALYETGWEGEDIKWLGDITMHKEEKVARNPYLRSLEQDIETSELENEVTDDKEEEESENISKKKKKLDDQNKSEDMEVFGEHKTINFEENVSVWSDFLSIHFHPKSVHIIEEYRHQDELCPFDLYSAATELLNNYETSSEWEDRIHYFTEECDSLQGFHVLADTHDGFGGLSAGLVSYLEDEFPGKGILTFGFTPANAPDDSAQARAMRIINSALAYDNLCTHSSLFVPASLASGLWRIMEEPVSFPFLNYTAFPYHTSAILASTLDTLSLPYRLESSSINIRDITHSFNTQGRKLSTLNAGFPLGLYQGESLIDYFNLRGEQFPWQPLTPHVSNTKLPFMQSVVMRGVTDAMVPSQTDPRRIQEHLASSRTRQELLQNYLEHRCSGNLFVAHCLESVLKTSIPFPQFFTSHISPEGLITSVERPVKTKVDSMPMITSLQSSPEAGGVIQCLCDAAAKMNIKKHHRYLSAGLEEDDYCEVLANLQSLAANYKTDQEAL